MSSSTEVKVKRGPGRPPGKKKIVPITIPVAKYVAEDKNADDIFQRRKRLAPTRLMDMNDKDRSLMKYPEFDNSKKNPDSPVEPPLLKRPRGRPPLSAGRGRIIPRSGRVTTKKSSAYAAYYGTVGAGKYASGYQTFDGDKQIDTSCKITKKMLSWLMTHDPQTISEITRGLSSSPEFSHISVVVEQVQAIADVLQILGIISVVHINPTNLNTGLDAAPSNKIGIGLTSNKYPQRLYCMKGFAKGTEADFNFDSIPDEIEKKKTEALATEMRIAQLKTLSTSMFNLSPEERVHALKTTLLSLMVGPVPAVSVVADYTDEGCVVTTVDAEAKVGYEAESALAADPLYKEVMSIIESHIASAETVTASGE